MRRATDPAILHFIASQPGAVRQAARAAEDLPAGPAGVVPQALLALGCGTSYHAAQLAQAAAAATPHARVRAVAAYEAWQFPADVDGATRVLAISHSGETEATLGAVEAVRAHGAAQVVAVTCHGRSRLARVADHVLAVPAADEVVGPKTKGFTASAAAVLAVAAAAAGARDAQARAESAAGAMERVLDAPPAAFDELVRLAGAARHLWVLGAGPLRPVAREGALKAVEMAGVAARAIEQEEFIHGWRRGTAQDHLAVALAPAGARTPRLGQVLEMCAAQGARLAILQAAGTPGLAGAHLRLDLPLDPVPDPWQALAYALPLQILAYALGTPHAPYWP